MTMKMANSALSLKRPAKCFLAFACLGIAEMVLIGIPGPCGMPGALDSLFRGSRDFEDWLAYAIILFSLAGGLISAVWWISSLVVRQITTKTDAGKIDPPIQIP